MSLNGQSAERRRLSGWLRALHVLPMELLFPDVNDTLQHLAVLMT